MKLLYGEYDGGGTTAIAFSADRILSGGRDKTPRVYLAIAHRRIFHSLEGPFIILLREKFSPFRAKLWCMQIWKT